MTCHSPIISATAQMWPHRRPTLRRRRPRCGCLCDSTQASTRAALSTFLAWWKAGGNWKEPCSTARSTGYIGLDDHMMEPLLRPGSLVLVDPALQNVSNSGWKNEYERPIYFVDVRDGYRCSWCLQEGSRLIVQPHPLSAWAPEGRRLPDEAGVVGQVSGVGMGLAVSVPG